jgi:PadR family transcriptional regulator, regulatory protein PadR
MTAKPMTGQAFFVLTALADGPRRGYGIVGEAAGLSQGRVKQKIGSLYGLLDRLAAEELIEPDREEAHDGRLRRYYRLTKEGRRALALEAELVAATARVVRARLPVIGTQAAAPGSWLSWPWSPALTAVHTSSRCWPLSPPPLGSLPAPAAPRTAAPAPPRYPHTMAA